MPDKKKRRKKTIFCVRAKTCTICHSWGSFVLESSTEVNAKYIDEVSSGGRLSHNEEERYIAVMKELQFG